MKIKHVIMTLFAFCCVITAEAQTKNKNAKHTIEVNGNCDMCKKRVEKAALSIKGVKSAVWHIDHQDMHLIIDETKCSLDDVRKAIASVGHDTDTIKADDEVYKNLHHCCLYERKP